MNSEKHESDRDYWKPIAGFAAKTAIVTIAVLGSLWIIASYAERAVDSRIHQVERVLDARIHQIRAGLESVSKIGGREFWTKVESEIDKLADAKNDLPPEKRKKLLAQIRAISDRWGPFAHEVLNLPAREPTEPPKQ